MKTSALFLKYSSLISLELPEDKASTELQTHSNEELNFNVEG